MKVAFNQEKFYAGFKTAVRAVGATIGPRGKNVYLYDPTLPIFTNDGARIASKITLTDPEEDAGAWVVRSMTAKTADEVGDNTTTTAVIAESLFDEIRKSPEAPVDIKLSLLEALPEVNEKIAKASHKTTLKDIKNIALVSAEHEPLADLITEIFTKKGVEAQITVQDSGTARSWIDVRDGYEAGVGMMDFRLQTDFQKARAEYKDIAVLCSHKKIDTITQLLPLYEKLNEQGLKSLVIVCSDMDAAALGQIVNNKLRSTFSTLVIRATGDLLDDIAAVVGATPVAEGTGVDFADDNIIKSLGIAASVTSIAGGPTSPGRTTFIGKKQTSSKQRATQLEAQADQLTNGFEKSAVLKRAGKLRSGVAVLNVGAYSEQEMGYLREKADDAIKAVRAALEEGYVEGGGLCLYRIADEMDEDTPGKRILKSALRAPFKKILENAGKDYASIVRGLSKKGYDAKKGEYADLIKEGIIDPAKGARIAVESAVSSVGEMIVVEALVVNETDK